MQNKSEREILEQIERNTRHLRVVYGISIITLAVVLTILSPKIIASTSLETRESGFYDSYSPGAIEVQVLDQNIETQGTSTNKTPVLE